MIRVLFVCMGNICRSPMAEAVFMHKVKEAGLQDRIEADSAGTGDWHVGSIPHSGTRRMLRENDIEYAHEARTIKPADFNSFDLILTMDDNNYQSVMRLAKGRAKLRRFLEFAPENGYDEVPDPYYDGRFDLTYELVSAASDGLLAYLKQDHGL